MRIFSKRWITVAFLAIAIIFLGVEIRKDNRAVQYIANCKRVEPGMTVEQAKQIMGGYDEDYKILNNVQIEYIHPLFARTGTLIFFNSKTGIVTEVVCGDRWYAGFDD